MMIWRRIGELPVWVRLLVLGRFINAAGALAWVYMAVYLVQERGVSPSTAGIIVGANGFGLLVGNLLGGWLGDRFGAKRMLLAGYTGWGILCTLFAYAGTPYLLAIAALAGFSAGTAFPIGTALIAAAVPPEQRRMGIAITRAAMNAGVIIGPPLGALVAAQHFPLVFVIDGATSLIFVGIIAAWVPPARPPSKHDYRRGFFRSVRRDRQIIVMTAGAILLDTAYRQLFTGLPLMLGERGQLLAYGILVAASSVLIVLAETPLAVVLANHPAVRLVVSGWALVAAGMLVLSLWPALGGAVIAVAVITFGEMLYKPSAQAHFAERAPSGMEGRFQSLYSAASIGGTVLSPPLGGYLYQHAPDLLWPVSCALAVVATTALALTARYAPRSVRVEESA